MGITFALHWGDGGEWTVIVRVELSTTSIYLRLNTILSNTSWTLSSNIVDSWSTFLFLELLSLIILFRFVV